MPAKIILNPYSNRWGAKKRAPEMLQQLRALGYAFEMVTMAGPGHGVELAREAMAQGFDPIVAAGGDGSISEVVNGMIGEDGVAGATLGVIPLGSANDYAYQLGIPDDLAAACQTLTAAQHIRRLDVGRVDDRIFMNDFILGLGAQTNIEAAKIHWLRGSMLYVAGALKAIAKARWPRVGFEWDGGKIEKKRIVVAYVGNGYRTGGVYFFTPDARLDDGLLDFAVADARSRFKVLQLLPKTFKGTHVREPGVQVERCTWLHIESDDPLPALADGELIATAAYAFHIQILPGALQVIAGETPGPRPPEFGIAG